MELNPELLTAQDFPHVVRGYDTSSVDGFLARVAGGVSELQERIRTLSGQLDEREAELNRTRAHRELLDQWQQHAGEMEHRAKVAQTKLKEAAGSLAEARDRLAEVENRLTATRGQRDAAETRAEAAMKLLQVQAEGGDDLGEAAQLLLLSQDAADRTESEAHREAENILREAREHAQRVTAEMARAAENQAKEMIDNARADAEREGDRARSEAERLLQIARDDAENLVAARRQELEDQLIGLEKMKSGLEDAIEFQEAQAASTRQRLTESLVDLRRLLEDSNRLAVDARRASRQ